MTAHRPHTINCNGKLLEILQPWVMGILNTTPDSFYDGGRYSEVDEALNSASKMIEEGADIIDIGGYSSRPGADDVTVDEELARVIPVIQLLKQKFPDLLISIDTFRAEVAKKAIEAGASIVNDISAGDDDPFMISTIAELGVPYIIMHKKGKPKTMQNNPEYKDVTQEVFQYLADKLKECYAAGIKDVIIDPGFGFGKNLAHNYQLVKDLKHFTLLEVPVLVGISRKSMIKKLLGKENADQLLNGTTILNTVALQKGASILRVHDVLEAKEVVKIYQEIL